MLRKYIAHLLPDAAEGGTAVADAERGNLPAERVTPSQNDTFADAFDDMERDFGGAEDKEKPPVAAKPDAKPGVKPDEKSRGADGKFQKPETKPEPKKEEKIVPDKKEPEISPEKMAPKQLRDAYETLRRKHQELEKEHTKIKTAPVQPAEDPEKKALNERLTAREKEYQALQDELRFTAYERSQEYKDKYEGPFIKAWQAGQERASKLKVVEEKNDVGEVLQAARAGTTEDFDTLMRMQDDDEAASYAAKLFGPKASMLLFHRERIQEANQARRSALEEFKKTGNEREKQRSEQVANQQKAVRTLFESSKTSGIEKYPQYFKGDESDPKTQALLDKGMRLADRAFGAPDEPGEAPLAPEQRIQLQAAMRNSFGAFQRVVYDLQKVNKVVKELQAKVEEYENSDPNKAGGAGKGGGGKPSGAADSSDTPEAAFDAAFGS